MYVFLLSADCLYTAPVDHERGCLPSPEELKGKILVKVRMHAYIRSYMYLIMCLYCTYIRMCVSSASLSLHPEAKTLVGLHFCGKTECDSVIKLHRISMYIHTYE